MTDQKLIIVTFNNFALELAGFLGLGEYFISIIGTRRVHGFR